jgi:hypothetical protein
MVRAGVLDQIMNYLPGVHSRPYTSNPQSRAA